MQSSLESIEPLFEKSGLASGMRIVDVLPGIRMNIWDAYIKEDITIDEARDNKIELAFVLDGKADALAVSEQHSTVFNITPGTAATLYLPNRTNSFFIEKKTKVNMLGITLHPHHLKKMLGIDEATNINKIICSNEFSLMSIKQKTILHQIFHSKRQGISHTLFLQSKALELLANYIDSMLTQIHSSCCAHCDHYLSIKEICSIKSAMNILENNMLTPPTLRELSKLVGLNINKLECGFRTVYNNTPYACLREARMVKASHLLAQGHMNVS